MDVLSVIVGAVISVLVTLAAIGVSLVVVERWKQEEALLTRLHEQVKRIDLPEEPEELPALPSVYEAIVWYCWRCKNFFESEQRPRPLCLCNDCLEQYQKVVA